MSLNATTGTWWTSISEIRCGMMRHLRLSERKRKLVFILPNVNKSAESNYLLINQGFAGKQRLMPFFNRQNNDDLILAIQAAGVTRGRNGFRKDKGGEKLAESEEDLLEHRTDGTDAFDTLYIGCEKFPQENITPNTYSVSGVV